MRKSDIANALLERVGLSRKESGAILETTLNIIKETLEHGETVKIPGWGNFTVRSKRERVGRNPKTGQSANITPRKVISFKAGPDLKKFIAES